MKPLSITPLGGAGEIGANCHYLDLDGAGLLLDAGAHPRFQGAAALPRFDAVRGEVDAIVVSHAHLDHVGALPVALQRFPRARVFMTGPTALLAVRMLRNAVSVARFRRPGDPDPLFSHDEVEWVEQVVGTLEYERSLTLQCSPGLRPRVTLYNAGHLLGAAGVLVECRERRIFYSGDTCESSQYLCQAARYPDGPIDLLVLDSTHGADPEGELVEDRGRFRGAMRDLGRFIREVVDGGGSVLIPVFAMGRAQEILGVLARLTHRGDIPPLPIYLSGLAHAVCRIYDATRRDSVRHHRELSLQELDYQVLRQQQSQDPHLLDRPCILAATSGMMFSGTGSHTLAARMAEDPRHGVAFVGYVDPESPGHALLQAEPGLPFDLDGEAGPRTLRCRVASFPFSAHSRASQLLHTARTLAPRRVLLVHGDGEAVETMARRLHALGLDAEVAEAGRPTLF